MTKSTMLLLGMLITQFSLFAQALKDMNIKQLETKLDKAVANKDYQKAAEIDEIISIKKEINKAVKNKDYQKAAELDARLNGEKSSGSSGTSTSVSSNKIEFLNTVYLVDTKKDTYNKMDVETAELRTSSYSAVWVAGASSFWEVDGGRSKAQLTDPENQTFMIKMSPGIDPETMFKLYFVDILHEDGKLVRSQLSSTTTAVAYGGAQSKQSDKNEFDIDFKKVSDQTYEIIVSGVLPPGEYAFIQGNKWYTFGNKHNYTNNGSEAVIDRDPRKEFMEEESDFKNVWLGHDCSLVKIIRTPEYTQTYQNADLKDEFNDAFNYLNEKPLRDEAIMSWGEKKSMYFNPYYGQDLTIASLSQESLFISKGPYSITDKQIKEHIASYEINYPGVGVVMIPELYDYPNEVYHYHVVWFDFNTRDIIEHKRKTFKLKHDYDDPMMYNIYVPMLYSTREYLKSDYSKFVGR